MKSSLTPLVILIFLSLGSQLARAEKFLVNWGGDYLDQEASGQLLNLGGDTIISDQEGSEVGVGFAYDETLPLSPQAERYNREKSSAIFYGVLQVTNPGMPEDGDPASLLRRMSQVKALARKNAIGFGSGPVKGSESSGITGLVYWQKQDFLQDTTVKIPWSKVQYLSVDVASINSRDGTGEVRFAIRNGNTWYLSEDEQNKGGPFVLHDSSWGVWKVEAGAFPLPETPTDFDTAGNQLTDITAVGVFFHATSSSPTSNAVFSFNSFQVESQP